MTDEQQASNFTCPDCNCELIDHPCLEGWFICPECQETMTFIKKGEKKEETSRYE